ncbi:hypothetical protein J4E86_007603 [Alternaria arbusti]|uniref:uncharacterized protein n=1 Tax=Alternaria arbusti TaxID=232088 RepID=UPI00221E6795|nr:uncharacterized protein J4E86_007603 [Alternaria arbusti]KAI4949652.1 hypothetical protein J4E86_007603 [Alternaria arbusti]
MPRPKRTASVSQFSPPSKRVANDAARHESSHPLGSRHAPVELDSSPEAEASTHTEPARPINPPAQAEPPLSKEQQRVVDLIVDGHNVFYTGSAGCGKSTILRAFVKELKSLGKVRICAPTNLAALNVGGFTLWSYAGWIVPDVNKDLDTLRRDAHRKQVWNRMNKTDVLVIDEISMVENNFFTRLNEVMKAA